MRRNGVRIVVEREACGSGHRIARIHHQCHQFASRDWTRCCRCSWRCVAVVRCSQVDPIGPGPSLDAPVVASTVFLQLLAHGTDLLPRPEAGGRSSLAVKATSAERHQARASLRCHGYRPSVEPIEADITFVGPSCGCFWHRCPWDADRTERTRHAVHGVDARSNRSTIAPPKHVHGPTVSHSPLWETDIRQDVTIHGPFLLDDFPFLCIGFPFNESADRIRLRSVDLSLSAWKMMIQFIRHEVVCEGIAFDQIFDAHRWKEVASHGRWSVFSVGRSSRSIIQLSDASASLTLQSTIVSR